MTQVIETISEAKFRQGKSFTYVVSLGSVASEAVNDLVMCFSRLGGVIKAISVTANAEELDFDYFAGCTVTMPTGTNIPAIRRNSIAATKPNTTVTLNPTITDDGVRAAPTITEIGQVAAGNRAFIKTDLLSEMFAVGSDTCLLLRVTNKDSGTVEINITVDVYNN